MINNNILIFRFDMVALKSIVKQLRRSFLLWLFNLAGNVCTRLGVQLVSLSETSLLRSARCKTGLQVLLDDFSRSALRALLDSYEKEADLSPLIRKRIRKDCVRLLSNNMSIREDLRRHPEILESPIRRPLFVVGLPRTGTTLLHNLLACHPAARVPLLWELYQPSPPPCKETRNNDPRIRAAEEKIRRRFGISSRKLTLHSLSATGPEECHFLFKNCFASPVFNMAANVPRYVEWLLSQDMCPAYRFYRQQLQLLQWRCPGEYWVLKSPSHLPFLDALFAMFPDALVIQTHRDPLKAVASFCSLVESERGGKSNQASLERIGETCFSVLATFVQRAMEVRGSTDLERFHDVRYEDLIVDPIGVVRRIHRHFGYDSNPRMELGMKDFLSNNPQNIYGQHRYSLSRFGLDEKTVNLRFAEYTSRFDIRREH